ncbi:hypothetical protein GWK47_027709 [Chionoecetes opilio]|uniref:Uncharacterized protein n=1 Tax=Chionoecetes opilio TaxID=41210 RepID=A0A8J8WL68_CHIOP|nr:hypothetical protein GWK47_027709 [Chionoecetes opilio]
MVSATVVAAGGDMSEVVASPATIKRHRMSDKKKKAAEIRAKKTKPKYPVLHWDGKIEYALGMHDDCNAVVLSGPGDCPPTFLGAPIVKRGTGQELCTKCLEILAVYDIPIESIIAAVFDTTASNTGIQQGCCTRLEQAIQHAILCVECLPPPHGRAACQAHVVELHACQKGSRGANVQAFPDPNVLVRWEWPADFTSSPHIGPYSITTTLALASKEWARAQLETNTFEREEYRELTESIYFYLGGDHLGDESPRADCGGEDGPDRGTTIRAILPEVPPLHIRHPRILHIHILHILATTWNSTIHSWHTSQSSPLQQGRGWIDVRRHMWYLVPEQVILCLFDDMVSDKEKKKVADALVALPAPRYFAPESQTSSQ